MKPLIEQIKEYCEQQLRHVDYYCYCMEPCGCAGNGEGRQYAYEDVLDHIKYLTVVKVKVEEYKKLGIHIGRYIHDGKGAQTTGYHAVTDTEFKGRRRPMCGRKLVRTRSRFREVPGADPICRKCEKAVEKLQQ